MSKTILILLSGIVGMPLSVLFVFGMWASFGLYGAFISAGVVYWIGLVIGQVIAKFPEN